MTAIETSVITPTGFKELHVEVGDGDQLDYSHCHLIRNVSAGNLADDRQLLKRDDDVDVNADVVVV
jgi:hypothetical protein